jgi:hypothetical protein
MGFNWLKFLGVAEKAVPVLVSAVGPQIPAVGVALGKIDVIVDRIQQDIHSCQVPCTVEEALALAFGALKDSGIGFDPQFIQLIIQMALANKKEIKS